METFGQLRIRLSVCTGHLCPTSAAKAESPGFRFFFLYESRRKARQFCKVKHLREQHVRGRMRVHIHLVREELGRDVRRRLGTPLLSSHQNLSRRMPAYIAATITVAVVYCSWNSACYACCSITRVVSFGRDNVRCIRVETHKANCRTRLRWRVGIILVTISIALNVIE